MEVREQVRTDDPVTGTTVIRDTSGTVATKADEASRSADKINQVILLIAGLINALLLLRLIFLLLSGHAVGFAAALYSLTLPLVMPFAGIFAVSQNTTAYFDSAAVVAIIVYSLIAWGLTAVVNVVTKPAAPKS